MQDLGAPGSRSVTRIESRREHRQAGAPDRSAAMLTSAEATSARSSATPWTAVSVVVTAVIPSPNEVKKTAAGCDRHSRRAVIVESQNMPATPTTRPGPATARGEAFDELGADAARG
jgi:hypothetical protein